MSKALTKIITLLVGKDTAKENIKIKDILAGT